MLCSTRSPGAVVRMCTTAVLKVNGWGEGSGARVRGKDKGKDKGKG